MLNYIFSQTLLKVNLFYYVPIMIVFSLFALICVYLYYTKFIKLENREIVKVLGILVYFAWLLYCVILYQSFYLNHENIKLHEIF